MKLIVYLSIIACVALIFTDPKPDVSKIDKEFLPYYYKFIDFNKRCGLKSLPGTSIKFTKLETSVYGRCYYFKNRMVINNLFWKDLNNLQREQLIFHELGHCLLKLGHDDIGTNLMNSSDFISDDWYIYDYDNLMNKLFIGCKNPERFKYKER